MALQNNIQKITLDFNSPVLQTLRFHQYDKDTRLVIVTCMEHGNVVKIDKSAVEARVKWAKPDKQPVINDETINDDGTITITCTEQMLAAHGYAHAEIMLLEKATEKVLHTMPFKAVIQKAVFSNDEVTSSYEFDALNNALIKVKEAEEMIAKFPEWEQAENDRQHAEAEREKAEIEMAKNTAEAISNANNAALNANHAASNATDAALNANNAASNANQAAGKAEQASQDALQVISEMEQALFEAADAITDIRNTEQSVKESELQRVHAENDRVEEFNSIKAQFASQKDEASNLMAALEQLESSLESAESRRNADFEQKMTQADTVISNTQQALSDANTAVEQLENAKETADTMLKKLQDTLDEFPLYKTNQSVISDTQPEGQEVGDLWFAKVTRN